MNENEFKEIVVSLELNSNERQQLESKQKTIENLMRNNVDGSVRIAEIRLGGSFKKGTILPGRRELDIVIVLSPKNDRKFFYKAWAKVCMNYIENCLYLNLNDDGLNTEVNGVINFLRNYGRNTLKFIFENGIAVDFLVRFKKENLYAVDRDKNVENFYLERDSQQIKFFNKAQQEYDLFKNTIKLIKHFRDEDKLHIHSYAIEILLYYSLEKYNLYYQEDEDEDGEDTGTWQYTKTYRAFIESFCKGIQTFTNGVKIEVTKEMYAYLCTEGKADNDDNYKIIDPANKGNNIAGKYGDNEIAEFNKLRTSLLKLL